MAWPSGYSKRIFAYLRPDTPDLEIILKALASSDAAVVCYGPGIAPALLQPLSSPRFVLASRPVDLGSLLPEASLCVSYAPAGTVAGSLSLGIPQLLAPAHVEAQLTAARVEQIGAGFVLRGPQTERGVASALHLALTQPELKERAREFATRYRTFDPVQAIEPIVDEIESLACEYHPRHARPGTEPEQAGRRDNA